MRNCDREILKIAVPSIVSNITVPLLGLIDVAIVGHLGSAAYIGAVAVGSMIFNLIYWLFAFLRMGASGMTAQALGRRDLTGVMRQLSKSLAVAMGIAVAMLVLQVPLQWLMFWLIGPTSDVSGYAATYFYIVVWGAPAMLSLYCLSGWFIGMQNTRFPMIISIMQNVINILTSLLLVYGLGMKMEGVAMGTVIAQYAGLFIAVALLLKYYRRLFRYSPFSILNSQFSINFVDFCHDSAKQASLKALAAPKVLHSPFFTVHRDIFLRTLCLVAVNLYFTSVGARQGAVILSVNTVLMQLYLFYSYFMDGFAFAGEALGGRYYGARNAVAFRQTVSHLFGWAAVVTALFTAVYTLGSTWIIGLITDEPQVSATAAVYVWWAWLVPAAGAVAFIWDGIFIGTTTTRGMLVSSAIAAAVFFAIVTATFRSLGNHGLWLALITYLAMRGIVQTVWYRQIKRTFKDI